MAGRKKENIVAILTDFGLEDNYVGIMKGVILSINPLAKIVDITHNIPAGDVSKAVLALKTSYRFFPKGTVFLVVVDPGVGSSRRPIVVRKESYFFVGPDNGLFAFLKEGEKPPSFYHITNKKFFLHPVSHTFHGRDIFAPVAAYLSRGVKPASLGPKLTHIKEFSFPKVRWLRKDDKLEGQIIDIDHFGNLITNVSEADILKLKGEKHIRIKKSLILGISNAYAERKPRQLLAIIGSKGLLEISCNGTSAQKKLYAKVGEKVTVF